MATRHFHKDAYVSGHDGIESYSVVVHVNPPLPLCQHCGRECGITIMYRGNIDNALQQRAEIDIDNTLLNNKRNWLCPTCWAKFQRQIVHIESGTRGSKKGK